ncbi:hypothetical protein BCR34DRAFT_589422 [Clohesyomyces aquaticus]|uniref:Cytochrome P450 n=1 Tax=Clohesyomyces aquaticus TaxID=1231657 RepID=A0A1Y1ZGC6_9PLEO|nr:hypothetical protein BCR34DRAFT_589422 [Clohesyomyces aquaticus]
MTLPVDLWGQIAGSFLVSQALAAATGLIIAYYSARVIYNLHFHPLSKYPGPRLVAATDLWWAYASTSGKYPWIIEGVLANMAILSVLLLMSSFSLSQRQQKSKNLELFVQVGYDAPDTGDNGISGEPDPIKHREIARKLAPAFSTRNFKAKEATVHKYIDVFVNKMREVGDGTQGAELQRWADWLALDLSADMTYGREVGQMRDMMDSVLLSSTLKLNLFLTMSQVTRKFRLFTALTYLTIPPSVWLAMSKLLKMNAQDVKMRIERRGKTEHLD